MNIIISDTGTVSSELNSIYQASFVSFFCGAVYGGFHKSRQAYVDFMENNQATAFKSHFEAKVNYRLNTFVCIICLYLKKSLLSLEKTPGSSNDKLCQRCIQMGMAIITVFRFLCVCVISIIIFYG